MRSNRGHSTQRCRGFSLVELMVVVTIVGVLSVVGLNAYRKHLNNARKSEVYALFGEIRLKEEAYRAEFSTYLSTSTSEDTFYPVVDGQPRNWSPAPLAWTQLGVNPGRTQVYCGFNVIAGVSGSVVNIGARGLTWFNGAAPQAMWWYANATCDNDLNSAVNALFLTSSDNTNVFEQNIQN